MSDVDLTAVTATMIDAIPGPLFAFHHRPIGSIRRATAIVICPPLGYDLLSAYRTCRHAAEQLCARGFHVLRFDYYGTGNSAGDVDDVVDPVIDVGVAIQELKRRAQVDKICLFGVRAGALIALAAAARCQDAPDLILLGAPASGRNYVRELQAFSTLSGTVGADASDVAVAGFVFNSVLLQRLAEINVANLTFACKPKVLLLSRDDIPDDGRMFKQLVALGCQVRQVTGSGYAAMMTEVERSVVPERMLQEVFDWCESSYPPQHPAVDSRPIINDGSHDVSATVTERGHWFGPRGDLFGVVTCSKAKPAGARHAVLLLNTGANHHVGSGRFYVGLARQLVAADANVVVLRFDISGVGESPAAPGKQENQIYDPDSLVDVQSAMDFLAKHYHMEKFILAGICSGAHLAFYRAVNDRRVIAQLPINLSVFRDGRFTLRGTSYRDSFKSRRAYLQAFFRVETWQRAFRGRVNVVGVTKHLAVQAAAMIAAGCKRRLNGFVGRDVDTNSVERDMCRTLRRGVHTLLLYSEDDPAMDTLALHCGVDAKRLRQFPTFDMRQVPGSDHTFSQRGAQRRLCTIALEFVRKVISD